MTSGCGVAASDRARLCARVGPSGGAITQRKFTRRTLRYLMTPNARSMSRTAICFFYLASTGAAQQAIDGALLDGALQSVRALVTAGTITVAEEEAAVRRVLQQEERLLLLAKHFGGSASFASHLRAALGADGAAPGMATSCPPPSCPAAPSCPAVPSSSSAGAAALTLRRSVKAYAGPVPAPSIARAFEAAVLAPNHFLTQPWRFYLLGSVTRAAVMGLNAKKADEFGAVPGWLVVTVATEYDANGLISTKKGLEDHAATAAAVQNFMLSLAAEGFGSKWMTGALGIAPDAILDAVGADKTAERFMGVIWHGQPATPLAAAQAPARSKGVDGVLKRLA